MGGKEGEGNPNFPHPEVAHNLQLLYIKEPANH